MTENIVVELVKQGGFAILCAVMFWVYRSDSRGWAQKQHETAAAYMAFGERTATALTGVSEVMRQQSGVLERIETHLRANHLCPVTQVTTEMMRDVVREDGPHRRRIDEVLRAAYDATHAPRVSPPREGQ